MVSLFGVYLGKEESLYSEKKKKKKKIIRRFVEPYSTYLL